MKKILIAAAFLILIAGFIPFEKQDNFEIKANYFEVSQRLSTAAHWLKWQPDLKNGSPEIRGEAKGKHFEIILPAQIFSINIKSANAIELIRKANHTDYRFNYVVVPGTKNNHTMVIANYKVSALKWLWYQLANKGGAFDPIADLKMYMENTKMYYGFDIKELEVDEKYVLVKGKAIPSSSKYAESAKINAELKDYLKQNDLHGAQPIMAEYIPKGTDSLQMMMGLPIYNQVKASGGFDCMRMPGGKIVSVVYRGKYNGRMAAYSAMDKYIQDHYLQKQIAPFEKYLDNKIPASDTDRVTMQIIFPVL